MTFHPRRPVLLPLLALVAGVVVGALILGAALLLARVIPTEPDSWATLGIVVMGLFLGVGCGVLAWLVGLVLVARSLFPKRRRLGVLVWSAGIVFALVVTVNGITTVLDDGAGLPLWATALQWVLVGAAVLTPSVVFYLWDRGRLPGAGVGDEAPQA
jgi:H+/Cl- antiporter ClcA